MALTPRLQVIQHYGGGASDDTSVINKFMSLFSTANTNQINQINTSIIGVAVQHAELSGDLSQDALHAINESRQVLLQCTTDLISIHDANTKLESLASTIRANRGMIRAIVGDTVSTMTTMKAGVAGVATAGGLYWSWTNFVFALSNIQQLAMTPAGAIAAAGAVNNIRVLLPEGGLTWLDYLRLSMNPEVIASIIPDMAQLEQQLADAGKLIKVPEGLFGSILNAGGNVLSSLGGAVNRALGGTLTGASDIVQEEVRHAHTQMSNSLKQASGSLQAVQNMFGGWIMVFVIILIVWAFTHLYRRSSNSSFKENVSNFLTTSSRGSGRAPQTPRLYQFKYSKSSSKRSVKKVKRSAKKRSVNKVKRSAKKRSVNKVKRSAKKRSVNKVKRSAKRSAKKVKRSKRSTKNNKK